MITRNADYSIQRLRGLSTDTKPVNVPNGSEFREMDTGKKFLFSAADSEWIEQPSSGGGSGGGGSGSMKVTFEVLPGETVTADKTYAELYQAVQNGAYVYAVLQQQPIIYHLTTASEQGVLFSNVTVGNDVLQDLLGIDSNNNAVRMTRRYPAV